MESIFKKNSLTLLFIVLLIVEIGLPCSSLDRQPNADYRARRIALAQTMNGGVAIIFAGTEAEGPNAVYGFRQENNFYYLSGWTEPGAALVIASAVTAKENVTPPAYSKIRFLPIPNVSPEKTTWR